MKAIILAAGEGTKIWPYNTCHNKGMLPIGTNPIIKYQVEGFEKAGIDDIMIVSKNHTQEIKHYFRKKRNVKVIHIDQSQGSGDSLYQVRDFIQDDFIVIYGDCFIFPEELNEFVKSQKDILISKLHDDSRQCICVEVDEDMTALGFMGHPRGEYHYFASAFKLSKEIFENIDTSMDYFMNTKVGVGSPQEKYLENAIGEYIKDKHILKCYESNLPIIDIDKPWHILEANHFYNKYKSKEILENVIGKTTEISSRATIKGCVIIGEHCLIGDNVVIEEGCIIGDYTQIKNGALIGKGVHIGQHCILEDYCKVGAYSSIGDECIISHTSELIEGVLFEKVYLYHYGEYFGVIGSHTDIGAGTTCGTLRFDDGETSHYIKGKREVPKSYSNACYLGDYSRTGVSAILLPGCKVGSKSVVGSGVILNEDLEDNMLIYPKQELCKAPWGDNKYGW